MGKRIEALAVGLLVVGIAALVAWPYPAPPPWPTRENFDRIAGRMSRAAVEAILGPPGDYRTGATPPHAPPGGATPARPAGGLDLLPWVVDEGTMIVTLFNGRVFDKCVLPDWPDPSPAP